VYVVRNTYACMHAHIYVNIHLLYLGTFGYVYKGTWNHRNSANEMKTTKTVAIKSLKST